MAKPMPRWSALALAALAPAALLAACAAPGPTGDGATDASSVAPTVSTPASPVATPDATRGPDSDLDMLLRTLEGTHPQPFHAIDREEFVAALAAYESALPAMTPAEAAVELMRVWATLARERDGHQFAFPAGEEDRVLPLRVYEFEHELWITDALAPHEDLAGSRIVAIGGTPAAEVMALVEPLVPRDGPTTVPAFRPILLLRTVVLEGLGVIDAGAPVEVTVAGADAGPRTVELEPISTDAHAAWAGPLGLHTLPLDTNAPYLADTEPFAVHDLGAGALYLRYRSVVAPDVASARERIEAGAIDRLILDLRQNPGGDNTTSGPLLELVAAFAADHPGRTFVLTDRVTFSAAANLATRIDGSTDAVFIGEPMAGGLNFWNDVTWIELRTLPIPMRVAISTTYWEMAAPDDPRLTIEPDVPIPVTAADHFGGRDPALAAALER
jgi:hypothetical protein